MQSGSGPRRLTPSEQRECLIFAGIVPLLVGDMRREWSSTVTCHCTDASPQGFGICERELDHDAVVGLGRWQERWRFKRLPPESWKPRERALGLDPFRDVDIAIARGVGENCSTLDSYVQDDSFPKVRRDVMGPSKWPTVKLGRWQE